MDRKEAGPATTTVVSSAFADSEPAICQLSQITYLPKWATFIEYVLCIGSCAKYILYIFFQLGD